RSTAPGNRRSSPPTPWRVRANTTEPTISRTASHAAAPCKPGRTSRNPRPHDHQDREPRRGALQPWKDGPESPAAHRTHGKRSLRPGTATQPPGGPGRLPAPRGGFPVPVEEGDGQAVELLIGALGDHAVHHLDPRIVSEPLGDG